ncbi:MAG TPA: CoA pyrophosphatase [Thermoanaerobaculia bacterium]
MRDPRLDPLRRRLAVHRPYRAPRRDPLFEAGVTLVLRTADELELLLIERVEREGDPWSGHMALPGGRREEGDRDLLATALRETEEEVGISLVPDVHLLGALDEVHPASRHLPEMVIAPWVAAVGPEVEAVPDPAEVATVVWVPLAHLTDEAALSEVLVELEDDPLAFPSYRYQDYQIWGLTFRILEHFLELYRGADLPAGPR